MKTAPVVSVGFLLVILVGVGGALLHRDQGQIARHLADRIDAVSQEVTGLRSELAAQRSSEMSPAQREAILKVVAEERAQRQQADERAQRQRFAQLCDQDAERAAKKFGLSEDQRKGYAEVLRLGEDKLMALDAQMRDFFFKTNDMQATAEAEESAMQEIKDWRLEELTKRMGSDLAHRINEDKEFNLLADFSRLATSRQVK
jgi:hypothetical protein